MSSANILLETSIAKTISTPSLFTVSSCVPIFGFINAITNKNNETLSTINLKIGLNFDRLGLKISRSSGLEKDI